MHWQPPRSQWKLNLGFMVFLFLLFVVIWQISSRIAVIFGLGIALGFTLQKARFCFTSALRDPLLTGITQLSQALILLLALSVLGFAGVAWWSADQNIPLILNIYPLGFHTIVGGILFGVGMVLAGGCASGVLMRIGEGFAMQMVAFIGLLVGALIGERSLDLWRAVFGEIPGIFLPEILGWFPAIILELLALLGLWKLSRWWQRKQIGG